MAMLFEQLFSREKSASSAATEMPKIIGITQILPFVLQKANLPEGPAV
jgi:hypothetical protein